MVSISGIEIKFGRIFAAVALGVGLILLYKHYGQEYIPSSSVNVVVKDPTEGQDPNKETAAGSTEETMELKLTLKQISSLTDIDGNKLGKQLEYLEVEQLTPDSKKPVIVLLHGAAFNAQNWLKIGTLAKLKEWGYRAIALNLYYSDNDRVFGVGEEKGVLIQKAIEALDLSSVVIVSPSASGSYSTPYILESHNHDKIAGYIPIAPVLPPQYTVDHFKELKIPSMIVKGDKPDGIAERGLERLQAIPGSTLEVLANAGHPSYIDNPTQWHKVLQTFLTGLSSQT